MCVWKRHESRAVSGWVVDGCHIIVTKERYGKILGLLLWFETSGISMRGIFFLIPSIFKL